MSVFELRVASGHQLGTLIPVPKGRFIIGREQDCHLRPNSELISRHHCAFTVDDSGIRVRDLGSTNGTFVNGQRVQGTVPLAPGDRVSAGKVDLVIVVDGLPATDAGDTIQGAHGDTIFTVGGAASANPRPAGNTAIDISDMSDALATLEDETVAVTSAPVLDAVVAAAAVPVQTAGLDTQEVSTADAAALAAAQNPQLAFNPWGGAPQYPYPQFPPMPYGYGYPYPPQGMPPGYPAMPPGYPMMPPGYGYPPQQTLEPEQPAAAAKVSNMPETRLPDPSETGAKAPEPKPQAPAGGDKSKAHIPTAAQDIINSYLNRRPKTS